MVKSFVKTKEKQTEIDNVDRAILHALDINSRRSNAEIAKDIRVNKNIVNYRINNLFSSRVIQGFYAVIDPTKLGFEGYRIYLKWQYISPSKEKEITAFVIKEDSSWWVGSIEGEWDFAILLWVKNAYEFKDFWDKFMSTYQKHVLKYSVCVYMKVHDFSYAFLSPKEKAEKSTREVGGGSITSINEAQEKILKVLAENARMPTVDIAKKLGLTPMIVKYNIKKLKEEKVIKGFRARINTELLGYTYYKINFWLKDKSRYYEILSYAKEHPNIIYANETIGFADFEVEALVKQHSDLQDIIEEMKSVFGNTIREQNYFIYKKVHKIRYY
jgi:Lrp/AsnC family transcriptional regulator for asnA, asnC and gidA